MVGTTINTSPFNGFDPSSRIWLFQTIEPLSKEDQKVIRQLLDTFISGWTAHQQSLQAAFNLYLDHFLVVSVDAQGNHATGCSLDALHQHVASIGNQIGKDLFNRLHIPVFLEDGIVFYTKKELKTRLHEGIICSDSLILDQTIQQIGEWRNMWITPIKSSWIRSMIPIPS